MSPPTGHRALNRNSSSSTNSRMRNCSPTRQRSALLGGLTKHQARIAAKIETKKFIDKLKRLTHDNLQKKNDNTSMESDGPTFRELAKAIVERSRTSCIRISSNPKIEVFDSTMSAKQSRPDDLDVTSLQDSDDGSDVEMVSVTPVSTTISKKDIHAKQDGTALATVEERINEHMVMETITLDDTDEDEPKLPELNPNILKDDNVAEPKSWKSTMKWSCIEISSDEDDDDDGLALQYCETSFPPEDIITISSEDDDGQDDDDDDDDDDYDDDDDDDGQNSFGSRSGKATGGQRNFRNDVRSPFGQSSSSGGDVDSVEIAVPRAAVGVVIGKGSDMIQRETGARVQFQRGCEDDPDERRCFLSGKPDQVSKARRRINELIDRVLRRDNDRGREGGRGGSDRSGGHDFNDRGGCETIKQINQTTGAHCELDRRPQVSHEKIGASLIPLRPDEIEAAKRMFAEKLGARPGGAMGGGAGGAQGQDGGGPSFGGQGVAGAPQQNRGSGGPQQFQQPCNANPQQPHPQDPNMFAAAPNNQVQVPMNPQTGQPDYSAQWAEYVRLFRMKLEAEIEALNSMLKK